MRTTHIHGISDQRRLVCGGKIKIGERTKSAKGAEIPKKLDYFRFVPENPELLEDFKALYGEQPRQLPVMLPSNDRGLAFPQAFCCWRNKKLWCTGDNRTATRMTAEGGREEVACNDQCPYRYMPGAPEAEKKQRTCKPEGLLRVMLPEMPTMHYFMFKAAKMSIESINTCLDVVEGMVGKIGFVPLNMSLAPVQVTINNAAMTVYVVKLDVRMSLASLAAAFQPKSMLGQDGMGLKALEAPAGPVLVEEDLEFDGDEDEGGPAPMATPEEVERGTAALYGPPEKPAPAEELGTASQVAKARAEEFDQLYAKTEETMEFFAGDPQYPHLKASLKNCKGLGDLKGFAAYLAKKIEEAQRERERQKKPAGGAVEQTSLV